MLRVDSDPIALFKTEVLKEKHTLVSRYRSFCLFSYALIFTFFLLWLSNAAFSQTPKQTKDQNFTPGMDVSLGLMGQMNFNRLTTNAQPYGPYEWITQRGQSASPSAGALFTFHQALKPYLGYNVNFSYTQFTQTDSQAQALLPKVGTGPTQTLGNTVTGSLDSRAYELTIAYAFYGPRSRRFRSFGQFGGGGLFFEPIDASFAHQETRPTMLFGVGGEYDLSRHLSLRAEYRGLFYKMPDFAIDSEGFPRQRLFTVTNTPAISLVYHFRSSRNQKQFAQAR